MPKNDPDINASEQLLSRRALATRWGCSNMTIKRREQEGVLRSIRFNRRLLRYRLSDIIAVEAAAGGGGSVEAARNERAALP
jgi:hypothetical protein